MTWYKNQISTKNTELSAMRPSLAIPSPLPTNRFNQEMPVTLTITNMNTPGDGERLTQALQEMDGILRVQPVIHQKKLTIIYNPSSINLNSITYKIAALGYHYVQRG